MFDDFEDPFAPPMEELELVAAPAPAPAKKRGPAYTDEEVQSLAGYGDAGDVLKNAAYAVRARARKKVLQSALSRREARVEAVLKVRDEELRVLASKLPAVDEEGESTTRLDALRTGHEIVSERVRRLKAQVSEAARDAEPLKTAEQDLRRSTEELRIDFKKADSAFKTVDDAINQGFGDPAARAPFEAEHAARSAERATLRQRLERQERELSDSRSVLAEQLASLQALESELDAAKREEARLMAEQEELAQASHNATDARVRQRALDALHSGKAGALLAAPSLDAFARVRVASREAAIHAAALNAVDDGAYRQGAEIVALLLALVIVAFALLTLL